MRRARTFCAGSFFLVTGLGCLIVGLFVRAAYQPYSGGIQTTAKVTGLTRENGDSDSSFRPELTFITNEGETIVFNDSCSSSDAPGVGEEVRISYRPSDPTDARNLDSKCKLLSWILLLVGAVLLSGAILVIARSSWLCYKRSTQRQRTGRSDYHSNTRADVDNPAVIQLPMNLDPAFGSPEGPKAKQQLRRVGSSRWSTGVDDEDETKDTEGVQAPQAESTEPQTFRQQDKDCAICYDAIPDHVLLPCGHGGFCGKCATAMCINTAAPHDKQAGHLCPVCRAPVHSISKVQLDTAKGQWCTAELVMTVQAAPTQSTTVDSQATVQSGT